MTRIVFILKHKRTSVNVALHLWGLGRIHTTASRVCHISECNRCKLVGVFDLTRADSADRSVYYSTTRAKRAECSVRFRIALADVADRSVPKKYRTRYPALVSTTWIGNRRRKYRLMGIDIPPPKGGPVVFPNQTDPHSPHILEDDCLTPELGEASEHNGIVSLCLSDDGASDLYLKENDDVYDESDGSTSAKHVKIEIVEEDDDDDDGDILTTEMEQMQNLLEFKNEEVQFLENELRSQKQKFSKLKSFTKSLLIAVKNKDRQKQRELLASLPQKVNEDWDRGLENHSESGAEMPTIQKESSVSEEEEDTDQMRL